MSSIAARMGSAWRRWDLHVHAPGTKLNNAYGGTDEATWDRFIDELEASPVTVFGITDYFCCDTFFELKERYARRYSETEKLFFSILNFVCLNRLARMEHTPIFM